MKLFDINIFDWGTYLGTGGTSVSLDAYPTFLDKNGFVDTKPDMLAKLLLTQEEVAVPGVTAEFAINMSNQRYWQPEMQRYIADLLQGKEGPRGKNYNMRWIAAMVGDVHRVLCRGGIFAYPRDLKDPAKPDKLRLMYEANPMSFLVEQAGGASSTGYERIMDIVPTDIHQRVAVILGSKHEVESCVAYHQR